MQRPCKIIRAYFALAPLGARLENSTHDLGSVRNDESVSKRFHSDNFFADVVYPDGRRRSDRSVKTRRSQMWREHVNGRGALRIKGLVIPTRVAIQLTSLT